MLATFASFASSVRCTSCPLGHSFDLFLVPLVQKGSCPVNCVLEFRADSLLPETPQLGFSSFKISTQTTELPCCSAGCQKSLLSTKRISEFSSLPVGIDRREAVCSVRLSRSGNPRIKHIYAALISMPRCAALNIAFIRESVTVLKLYAYVAHIYILCVLLFIY